MCSVNLRIGNTIEFSADGELYNIRDSIKDVLAFCQATGAGLHDCNRKCEGGPACKKNRNARKGARK